jgi:hypothetical protein
MATTYTLISSNVLTSSAASVTFSSIPGTYTDLVVRASVRSNRTDPQDSINLTFNGDASSVYSTTRFRGDGAGVTSNRTSGEAYALMAFGADGATATSNTFSNLELYIPSYTVSQNKPSSIFSVQEDNSTTAYIAATAPLWRNTSAITSIAFVPAIGPFASGSSFYLYGIKNS